MQYSAANSTAVRAHASTSRLTWRVRLARAIAGCALVVAVCAPSGAWAAVTGAWTVGATSGSNTTLGVTTTWSGTSGANYTAGTFNTTNFWTNPYSGTVAGGPSLQLSVTPYGTTRTFTVTFSKPVDNPVLHVDRIGGIANGNTYTSIWTITGSTAQSGNNTVNFTRLGGNNQFLVNATTFRRSPVNVTGTTGECTTAADSTGCGSIRMNGTGVTSVTFAVTWEGPDGGTTGEGIEFGWSFQESTVTVSKQSTNGTGTFNFSGTNGVGTFSLNTATSNPISSTAYPVTDHSQAITVSETLSGTSAYVLTSATCVDQNNAAVAATLNNGTLTIAAADYRVGQLLTCTFNNAFTANLGITKSNGTTTVVSGATTTYDIAISNAGPATVTNAVLKDPTPTSGLSGCVLGTPACTVTTGTATCPTVGAGAGQLSVANLQSANGVLIPSMASGSTVTVRLTCTVQ